MRPRAVTAADLPRRQLLVLLVLTFVPVPLLTVGGLAVPFPQLVQKVLAPLLPLVDSPGLGNDLRSPEAARPVAIVESAAELAASVQPVSTPDRRVVSAAQGALEAPSQISEAVAVVRESTVASDVAPTGGARDDSDSSMADAGSGGTVAPGDDISTPAVDPGGSGMGNSGTGNSGTGNSGTGEAQGSSSGSGVAGSGSGSGSDDSSGASSGGSGSGSSGSESGTTEPGNGNGGNGNAGGNGGGSGTGGGKGKSGETTEPQSPPAPPLPPPPAADTTPGTGADSGSGSGRGRGKP
jgi:hypothetical protein